MKKTVKLLLFILLFPFYLIINPLTKHCYDSFIRSCRSFYYGFFICGHPLWIRAEGKEHINHPKFIKVQGPIKLGRDVTLDCIKEYHGHYFQPILEIGSDVSFGDNCHVGCANKITIGKNTLIGSNVLIIDHNHGFYKNGIPHETKASLPLHSKGPIVIGENVWIGEDVIILPGVPSETDRL